MSKSESESEHIKDGDSDYEYDDNVTNLGGKVERIWHCGEEIEDRDHGGKEEAEEEYDKPRGTKMRRKVWLSCTSAACTSQIMSSANSQVFPSLLWNNISRQPYVSPRAITSPPIVLHLFEFDRETTVNIFLVNSVVRVSLSSVSVRTVVGSPDAQLISEVVVIHNQLRF